MVYFGILPYPSMLMCLSYFILGNIPLESFECIDGM